MPSIHFDLGGMSLIRMNFYASVLIPAIILLRMVFLNRLPKNTFLAMWALAVLRLISPFTLSASWSIHSAIHHKTDLPVRTIDSVFDPPPIMIHKGSNMNGPVVVGQWDLLSFWQFLWIIGMILLAVFFLILLVRCYREFRFAFPIKNSFITALHEQQDFKRRVRILQSDRIQAPLTYGILRPIILLPSNIDPKNTMMLRYILEHEYIHIRRFDALMKLLLIAVLCVHWFNPLVWVLYILANRDLELSCDEAVLRKFDGDIRSSYAMTLIRMEEAKSGFAPLCTGFSKNAIEERVRSIMKARKKTLLATAISALLILVVAITLTTSEREIPKGERTASGDPDHSPLQEFRFDGYTKMTVDQFRQKALFLMDEEPELQAVAEDLSEKISKKDPISREQLLASDPLSDFAYYILEPLASEQFEARAFPGVAEKNGMTIEYVLRLNIKDPSLLTVGAYRATIEKAQQNIRLVLDEPDQAQEGDSSMSQELLNRRMEVLQDKYDSDALDLEIDYFADNRMG